MIEHCYCGVIKDDMTRRPMQCDPIEEPSIDPEDMLEPVGGTSLRRRNVHVNAFTRGCLSPRPKS